MNDLQSFVILQARVYEFLERQDASTLQAIVSGEARLAAIRADEAPAATTPHDDARTTSRAESTRPKTAPSRDPRQAAADVLRLSGHERQIYLTTAGFSVKELRVVAKLAGLAGYSKLTRAGLMDLFVDHSADRTGTPAGSWASPPEPSRLADDESKAEQRTMPPAQAPSSETTRPNVDAAAIALRLRETDTEAAGAAYLDSQRLGRESLLAVAAELQLTRVDRLSQKELRRRILKQAIGARRKFAGLRKW